MEFVIPHLLPRKGYLSDVTDLDYSWQVDDVTKFSENVKLL